jgi:hypothetical protein
MSNSPQHDLEELRRRSEALKQQATDLFEQARDLDAKIRSYEQRKPANEGERAPKPSPPSL